MKRRVHLRDAGPRDDIVTCGRRAPMDKVVKRIILVTGDLSEVTCIQCLRKELKYCIEVSTRYGNRASKVSYRLEQLTNETT